MAAAPAMVQFVGGTPKDALRYSREMAQIAISRNPGFTLPALDFIGAPVGIDVRKVVDQSARPVINTATAHKEPGRGDHRRRNREGADEMLYGAVRALAAKHNIGL